VNQGLGKDPECLVSGFPKVSTGLPGKVVSASCFGSLAWDTSTRGRRGQVETAAAPSMGLGVPARQPCWGERDRPARVRVGEETLLCGDPLGSVRLPLDLDDLAICLAATGGFVAAEDLGAYHGGALLEDPRSRRLNQDSDLLTGSGAGNLSKAKALGDA
jgi:hypothetical protein